MVSNTTINGYNEFIKFIEEIDKKGPQVYFYFSGSKMTNGKSWCPDCEVAEPIVKSCLEGLNQNAIFAYVDVGNREFWKDKACPFRTDIRTKLMVIPTLLKWQGVQRLEGGQCANPDLIKMMFEEEED